MASSGTSRPSAEPFPFLNLPSELQLKVFRWLSFDEISRLRLVCKAVNSTCQEALNAGYFRVERFHARSLQRVKSQLPRRESERRNHELARHSDTLTSVETRLSLLSMTYGKYIESSVCCFIPGKVLDEMFRVLRIVNGTPRGEQVPRPHELLQELRDISSMAMEHFEEHIVPVLRDRINTTMSSPTSAITAATAASLSTNALVLYAAATGNSPYPLSLLSSTTPKQAVDTCNLHLDIIRRARSSLNAGCSTNASQDIQSQRQQRQDQQLRKELAVYKRELNNMKSTQQRQKEKMAEMERRLNEHQQQLADILAQLRSGGINIDATSVMGPGLGKRKSSQLNEEPSTSTMQSTDSVAKSQAPKRQKTGEKSGK